MLDKKAKKSLKKKGHKKSRNQIFPAMKPHEACDILLDQKNKIKNDKMLPTKIQHITDCTSSEYPGKIFKQPIKYSEADWLTSPEVDEGQDKKLERNFANMRLS